MECIPSTELKGLEKPIIPVFKPNLPCYLCNYMVNTVETIKEILTKENWRDLYDFDHELNPWYCPECERMYAGKLWKPYDVFDDDGWHDSIRGRCPKGHDRMLED